jgi:hypothetical protein
MQTAETSARLVISSSFSIPRRPLTALKNDHQTSFTIDGRVCASLVHMPAEH